MKNKILVSILAIFLVISLVSAIDITECQDITSSGNYIIQNELNDSNFNGGGPCLFILSDDVFIDGNNKTINIDDTNNVQPFANLGYNNFTFKNINIFIHDDTGQNTAPLIRGINYLENILIYNNSVEGFFSMGSVSNLTILNFVVVSDRMSLFDGMFLDNNAFSSTLNITNFRIFDFNENALLYHDENSASASSTIKNFTFIRGNNSINFDYLDITGENTISGSEILISHNFASVNSSKSSLNVSAHITLANLNFTYAKVLRNGVDCPTNVCTNLIYTDGTATFDVTSWSNYSIAEGTPPQAPQTDNLIQGSGQIYETSKSAGAGLGKFIQYLGASLPILFIILVIVYIFVITSLALSETIKRGFK